MNNIKNLQDKIFEIAIYFDNLCKEHNFTYYLCGGTLLGAVRHGGFIPWDDDIDVSMPREDYDKLINNYKKILKKPYDLQYYKNTKDYHLSFAKIVDTNTTLVEVDGKDNYKIGGAFIDIFPIDGAGDTYEKGIKRRKKASPYIRISSWASYSKAKLKGASFYKKIIMQTFKIFFNAKKAKLKLENFLRKKPYSQSNYVAVYVGKYRFKEIMKREIYGEPVKINFVNQQFYAPQHYKEYLNIKFGDGYMELPPEEKRKSGHNILYMNMDLPYEKFNMNMIEMEEMEWQNEKI